MAKIWQVTDVNANYMAGDDKKWVVSIYFKTILIDMKNYIHIDLTLRRTTKNSFSFMFLDRRSTN